MSSEHAVAHRRPPVKFAKPAPELSDLGLDELRTYRAALSAEEDKASYWRRLIHGRVDVLQAQAGSHDTLSLDDLVRVLGDTGTGRSRRALMGVPAPSRSRTFPTSASWPSCGRPTTRTLTRSPASSNDSAPRRAASAPTEARSTS